MRDRAKRAAKTTEDRAAAQQQRREKQISETEEQREVRLQRMRITQTTSQVAHQVVLGPSSTASYSMHADIRNVVVVANTYARHRRISCRITS